jgi:hypothetical protein
MVKQRGSRRPEWPPHLREWEPDGRFRNGWELLRARLHAADRYGFSKMECFTALTNWTFEHNSHGAECLECSDMSGYGDRR